MLHADARSYSQPRAFGLCLGAFWTLESLYVDAHEPSLGARRAKLSVQYTTKIKSAHKTVFDNK